MKLIISPKELENEFKRLTRHYKEFYWATAWASASPKLFEELTTRQDRIRQIVVGIHFYQTHPDFIETFLNNKNIKFIKQAEGTFHPKIYLFYDNNREWEILIGSANFTNAAFTKNTEATALISNLDTDSDNILKDAFQLIKDCWKEAEEFNKPELEKYRTIWKNHQLKVNSLSGMYGRKKRKPKPIHEVPVINMTWNEFMIKVRNEISHGLDRRLRVIEIAKELFESVNHFDQLTEDKRKFIAGIPNKLKLDGADDWGYFGSMKGAGIFKNKIKKNDQNISKALDQIPQSGQITRTHYNNFIKYFTETFTGNYIAPATRLLTMKRPDTFVCFDSKNKSNLCKDFDILQSEMKYDRYWEDIVERIHDSDWWLNPSPKTEQEERVSQARAAFLDSLYYEE